jgi:hypothetical protein
MSTQRSGILAAGNFIVDYVKIIDAYPEQDMLASILSESQANGGGPYNVLKDLSAMQAGFRLASNRAWSLVQNYPRVTLSDLNAPLHSGNLRSGDKAMLILQSDGPAGGES